LDHQTDQHDLQAASYCLQMSSTCQKNNKGVLVLESCIDSTSTWPLKQLSFFMDMSDVFLNNCANFPFIIFVVGGQEPGGVRAGAVHAGHAAGPLPGLLDGAMAESGDGRSAATRWTWRSSGRGAPCGMRWTCSSSMSLATARCCPYVSSCLSTSIWKKKTSFLL
jgi:hypothetical protein